MEKSYLNFKNQILSREEMKQVVGSGATACFNIGAACNDNVQCCSTVCAVTGGKATGKTCNPS